MLLRMCLAGVMVVALTIGAPALSATADPEPSLRQLTKQVESLHIEIEKLTEDYNRERERLKKARHTADKAQKILRDNQDELAIRRERAGLLVQGEYMMGGFGSGLAFTGSGDPDSYLDGAATTYALQLERGEEVNQLSTLLAEAERAKKEASAQEEEVEKIVKGLDDRRDKISRLIARTESNLYRRANDQLRSAAGRARFMNIPIVGQGKAAQAARYAMSQQLKPYVWGAEGPNSFDCSGLVMWAYQKVGINLPHYTGSQWTAGRQVSREDLRVGDLVFFYNDLHHVGIYIGGGLMVHAPRTGDVVRVASIKNRPFVGGVRIAD
ncbi:NlpC/P60 family protein [Thermopolyspora sp. NPDC052614]|uniref:C40 family peptidase n=1 Tax=Thermopolyspora sp. NPDC052614 TaxID=3155682 RepID=UPI00341BF432